MKNNCDSCELLGSEGCENLNCDSCEIGKIVPGPEIETPDNRVIFTKQMKEEYTILVPTMLPLHFRLFLEIFRKAGYKCEMLENEGRSAVDCGVKYVHNDACYPAICVIGQFIDALQSGKYDVDKVALIYMQTGGGCRASNYVSLIRKALERAGFPQVPVVTINFAGLEKHPGFKLSLPMLPEMMYSCLYGDLLMTLRNQCRVREINKGQTDAMVEKWLGVCAAHLRKKFVPYREVKRNMHEIVKDFATIERSEEEPVKVGVVGEIYVKYAALGNNHLEEFLYNEGAEAVVPGLLDFLYYCAYNMSLDWEIYGMGSATPGALRLVCKYFKDKKDDLNAAVASAGVFKSFSSYEDLVNLQREQKCVGLGMKMGEGWLLTTEMLELCELGVSNIICTQPFGCLPNHIVGKGMMGPVKARYPEANIVAIDYDPGASRINQENRLKLMLSNAKNKL